MAWQKFKLLNELLSFSTSTQVLQLFINKPNGSKKSVFMGQDNSNIIMKKV